MHLVSPIHFMQRPKLVTLAVPPRPEFFGTDVEAARQDGYERGLAEGRQAVEALLLEQRNEMMQLQEQTFAGLLEKRKQLEKQHSALVPKLVMEALHRVVAGMEFDQKTIAALVKEIIRESGLTRGKMEVALNAQDLQLIQELEPALRKKYPKLAFRADPELQRGDCMLRSRFGLIDGRLATKCKTVEACLE